MKDGRIPVCLVVLMSALPLLANVVITDATPRERKVRVPAGETVEIRGSGLTADCTLTLESGASLRFSNTATVAAPIVTLGDAVFETSDASVVGTLAGKLTATFSGRQHLDVVAPGLLRFTGGGVLGATTGGLRMRRGRAEIAARPFVASASLLFEGGWLTLRDGGAWSCTGNGVGYLRLDMSQTADACLEIARGGSVRYGNNDFVYVGCDPDHESKLLLSGGDFFRQTADPVYLNEIGVGRGVIEIADGTFHSDVPVVCNDRSGLARLVLNGGTWRSMNTSANNCLLGGYGQCRVTVGGAFTFDLAGFTAERFSNNGTDSTGKWTFAPGGVLRIRDRPGRKVDFLVREVVGASPAVDADPNGVRVTVRKARRASSSGERVRDIDVGRQLFVDDWLVGSVSNVTRHWNHPVKGDRLVLKPDFTKHNAVSVTDGGLWWDPGIARFRLWYLGDMDGDIHYAESPDLFNWTKPDLGAVPGTNRVFAEDDVDSWCVYPDYSAPDPYARWCLYISPPGSVTSDQLWVSEDGRHFVSKGIGGKSEDRSTMFYDPFRRHWVFSLRYWNGWRGRARRLFTSPAFDETCRWTWARGTREWLTANNGPDRSLYSFTAVPYESLMLGVMEILTNTSNDNLDCKKVGLPKCTALHFAFSRDGTNYVPRVDADIAPEGWGSGKWDTGYLACVGGICVIRDERLWFVYTGFRGDPRRKDEKGFMDCRNGMYSCGAIGYATLRRDGFAGMVADGDGMLVTKAVRFSGSHLFVNADCLFGDLSVAVLDASGRPIPGFGEKDCQALRHADSTKVEIRWRKAVLSALAGKQVKFVFRIGNGTLYSFWVSPSARGESRGYVAAGGPAYPGLRDL